MRSNEIVVFDDAEINGMTRYAKAYRGDWWCFDGWSKRVADGEPVRV